VLAIIGSSLVACNILENKNAPTPTVTPKPPEEMTPFERIIQLESRYSLLEREVKVLKEKIIELEKAL